MRTKVSILALLLTLIAGITIFRRSHAVSTARAPHEQGALGPLTPENRLNILTRKLTLTEAEQSELRPILEEESKQIKAIREDTSLAPDVAQAKTNELRQSFTERINLVLTPDQQEKWARMKEQAIGQHNATNGPRQSHRR